MTVEKKDTHSKSFTNLFDITNKVILVTGSNRGNGLAIAQGLMENNAKVVRIDLNFDEPNSTTDDRAFDLSDRSNILKLISEIYADYGQIDGLINNAGVSLGSPDPYKDVQIYEKTLRVNLEAPFWLCANICPIMASKGSGSIVNITSLGSELAFPDNPSYQMSKAGLKQLSKSIARDWGAKGIRANNICPGYMKTSMTEKSFNSPELKAARSERMILPRWGEPEDLVGAAIFLLSKASSYITGSDIYVDGGWVAKGL